MIDNQLQSLVSRLKSAFEANLQSVVLYGSAAMDDWLEGSSDLNILCVVGRITPHELGSFEPVSRWWTERKNPPPLLLTSEEVRTSTDCFPMEFHDMRERRQVLFGSDPIDGMVIDPVFYRAEVEHELRAKQIRLRQKAAEALPDSARLTRLLTDSLSTFCVLGRHALILSGHPSYWKKADVIAGLERVLARSFGASSAILAIRATSKPPAAASALSLLGDYLIEMEALVRFVDALER
ncbi:MAG: hypothetical protein JO108_29010 [Acidobacteriaceae bacterium]|nr:hypothetical protein [Acidobacteriaceae bacterium]